MPDEALFDAAARDELQTLEQIQQQVRRMLAAPRSRLAFRNFFTEWLDLEHILAVRNSGKSSSVYPDYHDGQPPELLDETLEFVEYAVFEQNASLGTLFSAPYTRLNKYSAEFYGITDGPQTTAFETVQLDPTRYSGILTHAGHLMANSTTELSSPIHRGIFVRSHILCQPPPPPPPDVPPPPTIDRTKTTREQFDEHSGNPACAGCHKLMDPIGLAFENFDAMGRYRDQEWGQAIDAQGTIFQKNEAGTDWIVEAEFDGVVELGKVLAESERVQQCFARQWFRFSMGRGDTDADLCSMRSIDQHFATRGFNVLELLVGIVATPAFRYRRVVE